jgi:hypothetical protein
MGVFDAMRDLCELIVEKIENIKASNLFIEGLKLFVRWLMRRKFVQIFGSDCFLPGAFHFAFGELRLLTVYNQKGEIIHFPYYKPGEGSTGVKISVQVPISSCEIRAVKYLTEAFAKQAGASGTISSDVEIKDKLDVSFVAIGGPASNFKARDVMTYGENDLISFDNSFFFAAKSKRPVFQPEPGFDYGIILKLHPLQFPEKTWIVCAGIGEWGSSGAAWYLANKWRKIASFAGNKPFAIIVRVEPHKDESAWPVIKEKSEPQKNVEERASKLGG